MYQLPKFSVIFLATSLLSQTVLAEEEEPLTVVVVSKSDSAPYHVKQELKENTKIQLKKGESINVRKKDEPEGKIVSLKGSVNKALKYFRNLFTIERGSILEEPWWFDAFQDDNVCYVSPTNLYFWRANTQHTLVLILQEKSTEERKKIRWYSDEETLLWPIPDMTGDVFYSITIIGKQKREIAFHQVPKVGHPEIPTDSPTYKAVWMKNQGCFRQANVLSSPESAN
jgi:hypothetical protein